MQRLPQVIAVVGLAGASAPALAHVDSARDALAARVQAVRQQLADPATARGPVLPSALVAQAANWNNWPKWSKWSNWANG